MFGETVWEGEGLEDNIWSFHLCVGGLKEWCGCVAECGNAVRQTELDLGENYDGCSGDDVYRPKFSLVGSTENCFQQW